MLCGLIGEEENENAWFILLSLCCFITVNEKNWIFIPHALTIPSPVIVTGCIMELPMGFDTQFSLPRDQIQCDLR